VGDTEGLILAISPFPRRQAQMSLLYDEGNKYRPSPDMYKRKIFLIAGTNTGLKGRFSKLGYILNLSYLVLFSSKLVKSAYQTSTSAV